MCKMAYSIGHILICIFNRPGILKSSESGCLVSNLAAPSHPQIFGCVTQRKHYVPLSLTVKWFLKKGIYSSL